MVLIAGSRTEASIQKGLAQTLTASMKAYATLDRVKGIQKWVQDHPWLSVVAVAGVFGGHWIEILVSPHMPPWLGAHRSYPVSIAWGVLVLWIGQRMGVILSNRFSSPK
jgi:hypothetical protein